MNTLRIILLVCFLSNATSGGNEIVAGIIKGMQTPVKVTKNNLFPDRPSPDTKRKLNKILNDYYSNLGHRPEGTLHIQKVINIANRGLFIHLLFQVPKQSYLKKTKNNTYVKVYTGGEDTECDFLLDYNDNLYPLSLSTLSKILTDTIEFIEEKQISLSGVYLEQEPGGKPLLSNIAIKPIGKASCKLSINISKERSEGLHRNSLNPNAKKTIARLKLSMSPYRQHILFSHNRQMEYSFLNFMRIIEREKEHIFAEKKRVYFRVSWVSVKDIPDSKIRSIHAFHVEQLKENKFYVSIRYPLMRSPGDIACFIYHNGALEPSNQKNLLNYYQSENTAALSQKEQIKVIKDYISKAREGVLVTADNSGTLKLDNIYEYSKSFEDYGENTIGLSGTVTKYHCYSYFNVGGKLVRYVFIFDSSGKLANVIRKKYKRGLGDYKMLK